MADIDGFLVSVPNARKADYLRLARDSWALFREYGALSSREYWGEDVPEGKVTSFPMAVQKRPDETVVLSWIVWPDKATRERCMASMDTDSRWATVFADMPFDGQRMIFGGFEDLFEGR